LAVPDSRVHRGPDPRDGKAFGPPSEPGLRAAVADLSWLLGKRYAPVSSLKLVGDRYGLSQRQRQAVLRASCSDAARARRQATECSADEVSGREIVIDGFNVLTTIEAALGGAVVLLCRDGTCRDLAGVHGTYRKVAETLPALQELARVLDDLGVSRAHWLFDRPVSNSGRIRSLVLQEAAEHCRDWPVELVDSPDRLLKQSSEIVATADSAILDCGPRWLNLARHVVEATCPDARVVDLRDG
jgi:hypothetical protein